MNNVVKLENNEIEPAAATPMDMLQIAVEGGADIVVLEKLMALQERWEANQGRKAFDAAIAAAKAEIQPVVKNKEGHNSKYADFAAIARVVDPVITEHGLSYRFETEQDDRIKVTCVLSHREGYSVRNTLAGVADTSGSKNSIQAIGSTLTYLQRYSLIQALGLAAADDDDGNAAELGEPINDKQIKALFSLIKEKNADLDKFCKYFGVEELAALPADKFNDAEAMLKKMAVRK